MGAGTKVSLYQMKISSLENCEPVGENGAKCDANVYSSVSRGRKVHHDGASVYLAGDSAQKVLSGDPKDLSSKDVVGIKFTRALQSQSPDESISAVCNKNASQDLQALCDGKYEAEMYSTLFKE